MRIIPGNAQHIGSRKEQQDDFGFSDIGDSSFVNHGGMLAVITDGMGGLAQGREASLIAKQMMLREYEEKAITKTIPQALIRALSVANAKVVELAKQAGLEGQIGTTLAAAVVKDDELYWASVGDSRIYLYRGGGLIQLTTDHDYARELAREAALGRISPEEAATHPQRQALTSYLGLPFLNEIDRNEDPIILEAGDRILLCSDGLYKTISGEEIVKLLGQDPQQAAEGLVEATLARGKTSQDNVTVAILACEPDLEIDSFSHLISFIRLYGKSLIIIVIIFLAIGSVSYLTARYYNLDRIKAKDVAIESKTFTPPDFKGPPLVEGESPKTPQVWKTKKDTSQEMTEEERPEIRNKKFRKNRKRRQAEVSTP